MTEPGCCETTTSFRISQRYVLGPEDKARIVLLQIFPDDPDRRKCVLQFAEPKDVPFEALCDPHTTVYKLPAKHMAIVHLEEVAGVGYMFEVEQLPSAEMAIRPLGSVCCGECPPYSLNCPRPLVPACVHGRLECIPPS